MRYKRKKEKEGEEKTKNIEIQHMYTPGKFKTNTFHTYPRKTWV